MMSKNSVIVFEIDGRNYDKGIALWHLAVYVFNLDLCTFVILHKLFRVLW
jgi:hypothetical protein